MDRQPRAMLGTIIGLPAALALLSVVLPPAEAGPADGHRTLRQVAAQRARPLVAQQRTEDRGFSLTLTSPDEAYLVGPQVVTVEPVVPPGDVLERAEFFIDGKLIFTDRVPPYAVRNDFGDEILQHTIMVRARTLDGREARVSFVSRSADISDSAAGPIEVIPAVVRDAEGRPVDDLTVSDFSLLENGVSRPIIHFDSVPAPLSLVVALNDRDLPPDDRSVLLRNAADIGDALPRHHALAFVDGAALAEAPKQDQGAAALPFSHDRDEFRHRIAATRDAPAATRGAGTLLDLLVAAASLQQRRGGRALLLITGGPPPPPPAQEIVGPEPPGPGVEPGSETIQIAAPLTAGVGQEPTPADAAQESREAASEAQAARLQALRGALEELKRSRVTINVVLDGDADPDSAEIALLRESAMESGGEFLSVAAETDLQAAFLRLSESLLHRYLISFQPRQPERSGERAIDVRVRRDDLQVQAPTALSGE